MDSRVETATDPATLLHDQSLELIWTGGSSDWQDNTVAAGTPSTRESIHHIPTYFLRPQHTLLAEKRQALLCAFSLFTVLLLFYEIVRFSIRFIHFGPETRASEL